MRMPRFVVAGLLAMLGVAAIAAAEEPPVAAPPAPAEAPVAARRKLPLVRAQVDWYGIYLEGAKVGYAKMTAEPIERDGKPFLRMHYRMDLHMTSLGESREVGMEEEQIFAGEPPHRVVSGWSAQTQGNFSQRVELQGKPGAFDAVISAGGQTRTLPLKEDPVTFLEAMKAFTWFKEPRAVGDKLTYRSFDLSELEFDDEELTVARVEKTVVDGVPLTYYVSQHRSKKDGSTGTMRVDATGKLLSMEMMGVMEVRLEPEEVAKQPGKQVDIFVSRIATIDKPLGEQKHVAELVVEVRGNGVDRIQSGPRQRATYDAQRQVLTLELGAKYDPKVKPTEDELRDALAEDASHPIHDAGVIALATKAIGDATTPRAKVERLVAFVDKFVEDSYSAEPLSVLDILTVRKGDCTEHSLLFCTLARALGIPSREVGGLMYLGDEIRIAGAYGFGGHAWNEVVLDGLWVPVDATWGQTEVDATHIRQAADGSNQAAHLALGGARLKLVSIERQP